MKWLKKLDAIVDGAALLVVQPRHRRAVKIALYFAGAAMAIWIPYSLIRHVYTSGYYLVSVEREARVGREIAEELQAEMPLARGETAVTRYINDIGRRITRENNPWQADFTFSVIEDSHTMNAFAAPGGNIYITTGLLDKLENEAELAAVLAHEVAHVTRRHYARNIGRQMLMSWVKKFLGSTDKAILNTGSFLTANVTLLKMRQEDELEADYHGALYMYEIDYDPAGGVSLMKKLLEFEKKMPDHVRIMAVTHPPSHARLDSMLAVSESLPHKEELVLGQERYRLTILERNKEIDPSPPPPPQ